ncbi:MAG: hypothetical protein EP344_12660 [Bacteroidetes bacterium]|nr:MAG: hypothetical protein EP344_12660 [Bacteroidota bacterium]
MKNTHHHQHNKGPRRSAGYAPNSWGRQQYGGRFLNLEQENIDLNNIDRKKGWILGYATRYFEGLKIRSLRAWAIWNLRHAG